jgi:hypothetical protein
MDKSPYTAAVFLSEARVSRLFYEDKTDTDQKSLFKAIWGSMNLFFIQFCCEKSGKNTKDGRATAPRFR